ncbi:MAG: glutamate--tRNA ligase [Hyphomicrobiaceae bacterium]
MPDPKDHDSPIVRFAPSPTGYLHIGNIRTAVLNWLFARAAGGRFILRFDDTDTERARQEYADAIVEDLTWLGLAWDDSVRQSDRTDRYNQVADALKAAGRLYPCFETPDDLERKRRLQRARGVPPVYDRAALTLTPDTIAAREAAGERPHWRFLLVDRATLAGGPLPRVAWDDLVRGHQEVDLGSLSDPVLIREDGSFLYTFTSVVDDVDLSITHIVRGEDHVTNTGVQMQLFRAIGAEPPQFAHHSLLVGADGAALSKRLGDLAIRRFREQGLEPGTIASLAALIGTSDAIEPHRTVAELAERFAFAKISRAPARFEPKDLVTLNAKLVQALTYADVGARLEAMDVQGGAPFWEAVRGNIETVADAHRWWTIVAGPVTPIICDPDVCAAARETLPEGLLSAEVWGPWMEAVKRATGRKGRALFMPIRQALTGLESGPELAPLLAFMGRERILARLSGDTA